MEVLYWSILGKREEEKQAEKGMLKQPKKNSMSICYSLSQSTNKMKYVKPA